MGTGPFGFNRPLAPGDEGILGVRRPLVGAANGVRYYINADSAINLASDKFIPDNIQADKEELEWVRERMKNIDDTVDRYPFLGSAVSDLGFRNETALRREYDNLENHELELSHRIDGFERNPEKYFDSRDVAEAVQETLDEELLGFGISRGPIVEYDNTKDQYVVYVTMVSLSQSDARNVQDAIENTGLVVQSREFFET